MPINLRESIFIAKEPNVGRFGATQYFRGQVLWKEKCNVRIARRVAPAKSACVAAGHGDRAVSRNRDRRGRDSDIQPPECGFVVERGGPLFFESRGFRLNVIRHLQSVDHVGLDIKSCANDVPSAAAQIALRTIASERAILFRLFEFLGRNVGQVRDIQAAMDFYGEGARSPTHGGHPETRNFIVREALIGFLVGSG